MYTHYCRGLTRTIYILLHTASESIESQPGIEPRTSCTAGEYSMKRAIRTAVISCHSGSQLCCYSSPPSPDGGSWLSVIRLRVEYAWRSERMHVAAWDLRITSESPLCRGLTRTIYILLHRASENVFCIEHLRMLCLSRESYPGPPALQASTLWKEPFERPYLVAIRDLTCAATLHSIFYPAYFLWDRRSLVKPPTREIWSRESEPLNKLKN
jgi:hypothetical protein